MRVRSKQGKRKLVVLYILLGITIVVIVVCGVGLGYELYITEKGQNYYAGMSSELETRSHDFASSRPAETSEEAREQGGTDVTGDGGSVTPKPDNPDYPDNPAWVPFVDFATIGQRYPGLSAWIKLEGTTLDYPVMQGSNNEYYLTRLPDGTSHRHGSIFIDYRNSADFSDKNTLVYGHMSSSGDMFAALKNYRKQPFYDENPVIHIYTPFRDFELMLFAGYLVDSGIESPPLVFSDDDAFRAHITSLKSRSFFKSDVEVDDGDRLVSLCTCAYDFTNARLVIVGKLVD